jgi:ribose 5-phosphate isomerase A
VEFGHKATAERLVKALEALGYDQPLLRLREAEAEAFRTDCGNVIYDCHLGAIQNAAKLGSAIHAVPGVVEHGLFIGMATTLLVATPGEVEVISR